MIQIDYRKSKHSAIIQACANAIKAGKVVAYPTDTSYGLAVDATNKKALKRLYEVKGRDFNKAVSVVVPSVAYAKKIAKFNKLSSAFAKKFWPGAVTLVLGLRAKGLGLSQISSKGFLGLRMPNNKISLDLSRVLKKPITATSANVSSQPDCYSAEEITAQYKSKSKKPDIIINAGRLKKRKPSTLAKIDGDKVEILRQGPVGEKAIRKVVGVRF